MLTVNWPFEHPLLLDSIVLGDSDVRSDAFTSTAKFLKGTLQDIRLNEKSLLMDDSPPEFHVETVGRKVSSTNLLRVSPSNKWQCSFRVPFLTMFVFRINANMGNVETPSTTMNAYAKLDGWGRVAGPAIIVPVHLVRMEQLV